MWNGFSARKTPRPPGSAVRSSPIGRASPPPRLRLRALRGCLRSGEGPLRDKVTAFNERDSQRSMDPLLGEGPVSRWDHSFRRAGSSGIGATFGCDGRAGIRSFWGRRRPIRFAHDLPHLGARFHGRVHGSSHLLVLPCPLPTERVGSTRSGLRPRSRTGWIRRLHLPYDVGEPVPSRS